jgi:HEAT repeat protein
MPLIKRDAAQTPSAPAAPKDANAEHLAALGSPDADSRWRAARALGGHTNAVAALADLLNTEKVPRVREAVVTALIRTGDRASVSALIPHLRSQDAAMRSAVGDALQALPAGVFPFMEALLSDSDSDVRILATELVRNMRPADATSLLAPLLEREEHPNVCGAAIEVLSEVGTADAVPALRQCAARFAATPFLPFAASTAIARLSRTEG